MINKFYETHFDDYISEVNRVNMHPKLFKKEKDNKKEKKKKDKTITNMIFYGPSGVGKYSQMLYFIKEYSPSELKYEKKLHILYDKKSYIFKISDIHYEVDLSLLGCNSKLLWHEIYQQIVEVIQNKSGQKMGIIVCKNFHSIHSELLDNFYSYMQENQTLIDINFILITEEISFIPDTILNCCNIIHIPRPSKIAYNKCLTNKVTYNNPIHVSDIHNIKYLYIENNKEISLPYKIMCDKIIHDMININELKFTKFRDLLYDLFIYNLDMYECIWYILTNIASINKSNNIKKEKPKILLKTFEFFKYYNNNYRPIYHLESYLYYLISIIHGYNTSV